MAGRRIGMHLQRLALLAGALAGVLFATAASAASTVEVSFVEPERFTDASPRSYGNDRERDAILADLRAFLIALGQRYLRENDRLWIEVLDVDLAGQFEPVRRDAYDLRVLRDIAWPSIVVRTTLERDGRRDEQQERVSDMNYLMSAAHCRYAQALCYEKRMLDDWFARRFGAPTTANTQ